MGASCSDGWLSARDISQALHVALVPADLTLGYQPHEAYEHKGRQDDPAGEEEVVVLHSHRTSGMEWGPHIPKRSPSTQTGT